MKWPVSVPEVAISSSQKLIKYTECGFTLWTSDYPRLFKHQGLRKQIEHSMFSYRHSMSSTDIHILLNNLYIYLFFLYLTSFWNYFLFISTCTDAEPICPEWSKSTVNIWVNLLALTFRAVRLLPKAWSNVYTEASLSTRNR